MQGRGNWKAKLKQGIKHTFRKGTKNNKNKTLFVVEYLKRQWMQLMSSVFIRSNYLPVYSMTN